MHDGVRLETPNRPTVVVVTTEFQREALTPAVIPHPLSTLTGAEIDARATAAATQAIRIWRGGGEPGAWVGASPGECSPSGRPSG